MKIAHVTGYYIKGMGYQENYLPRGQVELGHEVTVLTGVNEPAFVFNESNRFHEPGSFDENGVIIKRLPIYYEMKNNKGPFLKNLFNEIKLIRPNILFCHDVGPSFLICLLYKFLNKDVLLQFDCHSTEANAANSFFGKYLHYFFGCLFFLFGRYFNDIFAVAPETSDFIQKYYFLDKSKITHLPLPGDSVLFNKKDAVSNEIRVKNNLSNNDFIILHTGKMPEDKETFYLIDIVNQLEDVNLLLIGSIADHAKNEFHKKISLNNRIKYLGWMSSDEVLKYYCAADLIVQPGSLSNSFIDAACCGCPLILDDTPMGRHLTSFNNGLVIKRNDSNLLMKTIKDIQHKNITFNNLNDASNFFHYKNIAAISLSNV